MTVTEILGNQEAAFPLEVATSLRPEIGELRIELKGNLAAMLSAATNAKIIGILNAVSVNYPSIVEVASRNAKEWGQVCILTW